MFFFFFNDTATTEIYTLSLHDALPIYAVVFLWYNCYSSSEMIYDVVYALTFSYWMTISLDRKSTRLNSSHLVISYAVFCLKKKKNTPSTPNTSHTILNHTISNRKSYTYIAINLSTPNNPNT